MCCAFFPLGRFLHPSLYSSQSQVTIPLVFPFSFRCFKPWSEHPPGELQIFNFHKNSAKSTTCGLAQTDPREIQMRTLGEPRPRTVAQFHEDPQQEMTERNCWRKRGKSVQFWASHNSGPHSFSSPTLRAPTFALQARALVGSRSTLYAAPCPQPQTLENPENKKKKHPSQKKKQKTCAKFSILERPGPHLNEFRVSCGPTP